ncbi:MAG: aromatic ring-hydroxylating dioxygenase subunit alpha [Gammaproteobacteria bacterium]|nr:aromatic ring-hydroxylating dioxygenase subunit alpha [Gammaproteobacteria bacterium]
MMRFDSMFDPATYHETRKPLLRAQTLPSHCYTSPEFFRREVEAIFSSAWHFVGREDEIRETGTYTVIDVQAGSVIVCRDRSGGLQAFVNACRHRGTRLKDGQGRCNRLVCPYHAWTYDLDGSLSATPGFGEPENFNRSEFALQGVRLENWGGFLFVNFSAQAPPLLEWIGDMPAVFAAHHPEDLRCTWRKEYLVRANWKFLIENALEAYHTGTVHGETLGTQNSEFVETRGNWDALYVLGDPSKSIATLPGENQVFPFVRGLSGKASRGTWFTVVYPGTQIVFSQDCAWWLDMKPLSVDRTLVTLGGCFPASTVAMAGFEQQVTAFYERWSTATPEDNQVAEAQQRGHASGLGLPGRYSETEHCVHALDNWVLDQVLD